MSLWGRVMYAAEAWRSYGQSQALTAQEYAQRYALLGMFYKGTWASDARFLAAPDVYRNARQVVKKTGAIVDCYEQLVYAGDIPTFGRDLPEGVLLAIPIEAQTGKGEAADEALVRAFYTAFDIGKWQRLCSLVPRTCAIYGDCLVELFDDHQRGVVIPKLVNPWHVPHDSLELDEADNVKAVAIEYDVVVPESTAFGRTVKAERYRYRKEMTTREFRFYKNDKPWNDPDGHGDAVQPNPYGFVPAAWFRHELVAECDRGMGAYERTLMQAMEINSLLSSAFDYQRKQFGAPVGVVGSAAVRPGRTLTMPGGLSITASTTQADIAADRRQAAENVNLLPMDATGKFVTVSFDIGQTRELMTFLDDNMTAENPEAKYAQLLAELRQATGPGVSMTLAPIKAKVMAAQRNHNPQMLKLAQMDVSMMGFRLNNGDIPEDLVLARPDRYEAFRPYTLASFGQGLLDASIPPRDPFPETRLERAQWVTLVDGMSSWGKRQMGVSDEELAEIEATEREAQDRLDAQLTGIAATAATAAAAGATTPEE